MCGDNVFSRLKKYGFSDSSLEKEPWSNKSDKQITVNFLERCTYSLKKLVLARFETSSFVGPGVFLTTRPIVSAVKKFYLNMVTKLSKDTSDVVSEVLIPEKSIHRNLITLASRKRNHDKASVSTPMR